VSDGSAKAHHQSLRLRLALAGAASLIVTLVVAFFGLSLLFERHVERRVAAELTRHVEQLIAALDLQGGKLTLRREPTDPRFLRPLSGLYWQLESGDQSLRSRSLWDAELDLPPVETGAPVSQTIEGPAGTSLLLVERQIVAGNGTDRRTVRLAVANIRTDIEAATGEFRRDMLPYLTLLGALFIAGTIFQIAIGLRPLAAMRSRVSEIRRGTAQRMGNDFPTEILPLTRELDELVASRELQIERARAHAADFAHGLKTPLQALAGDIDRLRDRGEAALAEDIQALAQLMGRHVDHQLARARMAGRPVGHSKVGEAIERLVRVLSRTPKGSAIDWNIEVADDIKARIDAQDLTELLGSLLDNALRYAREKVEIKAQTQGANVLIEIRDDGPGIPDDRIGEMLERGGRLDETSGGAGLGLAIARDIAAAADGSVKLENGDRGLCVTVTLAAAE
jgi:signal transduction histidine kinase